MSSACAAYLVTHERATRNDEPDVSLLSKDSTKAGAGAPMSASTPAPAAPIAPAPAFTVRQAPLERTFAAAAQSIGVDAGTTAILSRAFRGELDLSRDLQPGDRVSAVFDDSGDNSKDASHEPLAVRIVRGSTAHDVFLHKSLQGQPFYYSKDGVSTGPAFERYPLDFTRVSSAFSLRRFDPVLHRWQSHDGVDLAAPAGTPVHATARGVIRFIGRQSGYGNVVVIQNPAPFSTTFAHLSRFAKGLRAGSRVMRDQVIGYVGKTGWATGPHLHFEVHVNDVPQDPLKVDLPRKRSLAADELRQFESRVAQLTALL
ncbi:M23 family metallopeptidase [Paraburkholderia sp. HD33-4]|uniref:M23 family metallopeptidase n=1 Tax=Paraburkholderia sp. HD33-4 TaxID=2883242 RepID=UPI001F3BE693|nr:M23 family metallopeptidase [Paraburkholderia sp. HD33-4]